VLVLPIKNGKNAMSLYSDAEHDAMEKEVRFAQLTTRVKWTFDPGDMPMTWEVTPAAMTGGLQREGKDTQ